MSQAATEKHDKYDDKCAELGWICIPLAVDSYGQWCDEAHHSFHQIATRLSTRTKVSFSSALSSIYNTLNIVLVRQNALSILSKRSLPLQVGSREVSQLASIADHS